MKNKLVLIIILLLSVVVVGQKRQLADVYFEDYAFIKSAELYEKTNEKEYNKQIISRLADSYYFNSEIEKASYWYDKLVSQFDGEILKEHLFRYAQTLRSIGNFKVSDSILKKHFNYKNLNENNKIDLSNNNYISNILAHSDNINVNIYNVATNTENSDFGGFIKDNKFYFASTLGESKRKSRIYQWNDQPFLDLYSSVIEKKSISKDSGLISVSDLKNKSAISKHINSKFHEASMIITKNGKTMYFTRDNYNGQRLGRSKKSVVMLKIYRASLIDNKWKNITELPFNSDEYSTGHPALSSDEKTLYFVSDMPGGFGNTDIYKVVINEDGSFDAPENLGEKINTIGREMFPFIGPSKMLYFSSDGHKGMGALDIYETEILDSEGYLTVKNLDKPFNSNLDDFGFTINENKKEGFFSSNRAGGKGDDDIYSFSFYRPRAEYLKNISVIEYVVNQRINLKIPQIVSTGESPKQLESKPVGPILINGNQIDSPIYFDFDSYKITKDAVIGLNKIVALMNENPEMIIKIESHTDSKGSKTYNQKLSDKRARVTRDYIISKGISLERIESAIGYGESKLLPPCNTSKTKKCTEKDDESNRRSYFYIVSPENYKKKSVTSKISTSSLKTKETLENQEVSSNLMTDNEIVVDKIYFDFNKSNIRKDAAIELEKVIDVMNENPKMVIKIESHTDSRGSKTYNRKLSNKRAISTRDYIISRGIDKKRIESAIGYGEDKLLNNCNDKNQRKCKNNEHELNRRSHFYIVKYN